MKRLTQEQADGRINEVLLAKNYTLLEPYVHKGVASKLILQCNTDLHVWEVAYRDFVYGGNGCQICGYHKIGVKKRLAQEQADGRINEVLLAKNYTLLEPYVHKNPKSKMKLQCNTDLHIWEVTYNNFVHNGKGCVVCAGTKPLTQEQADSRINEVLLAKNYTLLEPYVHKNPKSNLILQCNTDLHVWEVTYNNFVHNGKGCSVCAGIHPLTQEQADSRINEVLLAKNYTLLEPYVHGNVLSKMKLQCNTCNHVWDVAYNNLINAGTGCGVCGGSRQLTQEQADGRINEVLLAKNYTLLEPYVHKNTLSKMKLHCNNCHHKWPTTYTNLVLKGRGCAVCAGQNQKLAYISLVLDNEVPVGIKYGIETTLGERAKQQNSKNIFDAKRIKTFEFETVQDCKTAEKKCKKIFQKENEENLGMKGVVTVRDFEDGWSETTTIQNMDRVIEIYKSFGGVEVLHNGSTLPPAPKPPTAAVQKKGTPFASIKGRTLSLV